MRIYLDEDLASGLLAKLLQKAGPDTSTPSKQTRGRRCGNLTERVVEDWQLCEAVAGGI
jgi:hypothetical protein